MLNADFEAIHADPTWLWPPRLESSTTVDNLSLLPLTIRDWIVRTEEVFQSKGAYPTAQPAAEDVSWVAAVESFSCPGEVMNIAYRYPASRYLSYFAGMLIDAVVGAEADWSAVTHFSAYYSASHLPLTACSRGAGRLSLFSLGLGQTTEPSFNFELWSTTIGTVGLPRLQTATTTPIVQPITETDWGFQSGSRSLDFAETARTLRAWLGVTYEDLAAISGVGRTTFFDWARTGRTARPTTTRRLLRLYALARALVERLGVIEAATWFRAGQPARIDLLRAGDFDTVERAATAALFRPTRERRVDYAAFAPESDFDVGSNQPVPAVLRSAAVPRRIKYPRA